MSLSSHISTASGQKVLVAEGAGLVFGRGPGVDLIVAAGRHLLALTEDLADLAGAPSGRLALAPEVFDAAAAIGEDVRLMSVEAHRRGVDLTVALSGESLMVTADRRRLRQIVLNLLANALKFTPAGGAVTVTVEKGDSNLVLAVAYTGAGIAAGDLAEVAEAARPGASGVGLGLSLVRLFSRAHGGGVDIESAPGAGTTVRVSLPVLI